MKDGTDENGNEYKKYRKDENVIYRDVITLDYDDIPKLRPLHDAITDTLKVLHGFGILRLIIKQKAPEYACISL